MKREHNGELDFLKFCAAVCILLFHATHLDYGNVHAHLGGLTYFVEWFFILSGMFMAERTARFRQENNNCPHSGRSLTLSGVAAEGSGTPDQTAGHGISAVTSGRNSRVFLSESRHYLVQRFLRLAPEYYIALAFSWIIDLFNKNTDLYYNAGLTISTLDEIFMIHSARNSYAVADPATWYISALLIGAAVLYPLLLFLGEWFTDYLAPLCAVLIWGLSWKFCGDILSVYMPLRAIMGLCWGCTAWCLSDRLSGVEWGTRGRRLFLSCLALLCAAGSLLILLWRPKDLQWEVFLLFVLLAAIVRSGRTAWHGLFQHRVFTWLGGFSYCLYLSNNSWSWVLSQYLPDWSFAQLLVLYLILCTLTAAAVHCMAGRIRSLWRKKHTHI